MGRELTSLAATGRPGALASNDRAEGKSPAPRLRSPYNLPGEKSSFGRAPSIMLSALCV